MHGHSNQPYDQANKSTLLSLAEALTVTKDVPVKLKKEVFFAGEYGWKKLLCDLMEAAKESPGKTVAGVLISTPYSAAVNVQEDGSVLVLDSHAHGPRRGALLAANKPSASLQSIATYWARFLSHQHGCSQKIRLLKDATVDREYSFGLLASC